MSIQLMKQYEAYTDSGAFWLGNIPTGWSCRQLKYVAGLSTAKNIPTSADRYVGMENVRSGDGTFVDTGDQEPEGLSLSFNDGDVLFGKLRPYLAKSWLASFSGVCSSEFLVLSARAVSPRFLNYVTLSREFISVVDSSTYGAKMPRASWDFIGMLKVPVPEAGSSAKIAKFLDYETAKIDALIEKQQQLIALLKEKRQAVISHAVTKGLNPDAPMRDSGVEWLGEVPAHWEILNLNRVVKTFVDYRGRTPEKVDEGRPLVTAGAVRNGIIDLGRAPQFVTEETYHMLRQRGLPEVGDLLFTSEAPLGEVAIVEDVEFACAQRIIMFKLNRSKMQPQFMWLYLRAQAGQDEIQTKASGSTAEGIRADRLRRCRVLVPPLGEQAEIAVHVKNELCGFDEILNRAADQTQLLRERRTALISAAVTGKIDVRGWKPPKSKPQTEAA